MSRTVLLRKTEMTKRLPKWTVKVLDKMVGMTEVIYTIGKMVLAQMAMEMKMIYLVMMMAFVQIVNMNLLGQS